MTRQPRATKTTLQSVPEGRISKEERDIAAPLHARKPTSDDVADFTVRENCYKFTIPVHFQHRA